MSLALTLGEPAGIGPEITLLAWHRRTERAVPPFYVLADPAFMGRLAERIGLAVPIAAVAPGDTAATFGRALPVVALDLTVTVEPGRPDGSSAPAAIAAIERAVADVVGGKASAVVTNPVAKSVLYRNGFADPGENVVHGLLNPGVGLVKLARCLGDKLAKQVPVTHRLE